MKKVCVIVNPYSAGGKTAARIQLIEDLTRKYFGPEGFVFLSAGPRSAVTKIRESVMNGCSTVIAVGGDGTIQNAVTGLWHEGRVLNPECGLGIISSGTGQGFAQSTGLLKSAEDQFEMIKAGAYQFCDLGEINFYDRDLPPQLFINEFQAGIGGAVVKNLKTSHKCLGGKTAFALSTLITALSYPNRQINISIDGRDIISGPVTGVVIANGAFTGGGMNLVPDASPFDGRLNVLVMHDLTRCRRFAGFPRIYNGTHVNLKGFSLFTGKTIKLSSLRIVDTEADGEIMPGLSCGVKIIPSALKIHINQSEVNYVGNEKGSQAL